SRMSYSSDLHQAVADVDLVIEAVPEIPAVKTEVYETMAPSLSAHTLVATNSSTLLPRDFAEATGRPEKYCSLHFANLLWSLNLVEIMGHEKVASETLVAATRFAIEIGMVPIPVGKEQNGYVLNSWLVALLKTSLALVVDGVCTAEDVDRTFLIANRPAKVGPFGMADLIGMGTLKNVLEHWGDELDDARLRRCAAYVQENFIDRGYMGTVSGQGFYTYPNPAYADPGFLSVPSMDQAEAIAARSVLK
ncbi:MAG: 3-hydroxyacyl-CoA dehydrogenase NAD-binding domain-containing protein, partial [Myxococcota bacterium]